MSFLSIYKEEDRTFSSAHGGVHCGGSIVQSPQVFRLINMWIGGGIRELAIGWLNESAVNLITKLVGKDEYFPYNAHSAGPLA